jgi:small subunit ribosomal protein S13
MVQLHLLASPIPIVPLDYMLILGQYCPPSKAFFVSLKAVFGVNTSTILKLSAVLGISPRAKFRALTSTDLQALKLACGSNTRPSKHQYTRNIQRLIQLKHYVGFRHMFALPVRGQRTRTNAMTAKRLAKRQGSTTFHMKKKNQTKTNSK